jgi:hypothetical protein
MSSQADKENEWIEIAPNTWTMKPEIWARYKAQIYGIENIKKAAELAVAHAKEVAREGQGG